MTDLPVGGSRAALFLSPLRARIAPSARFWLVPAFLAFVALVPLAREGLPVTQAGLLPLNGEMAKRVLDLSTFQGIAERFIQGVGNFKFSLALSVIVSAVAMGFLAHRLWKAHGWWVASLWLTMPFLLSLVYQRGIPLLGLLPLSLPVIARYGLRQVKPSILGLGLLIGYLVLFMVSLTYFLSRHFWSLHPPLYAHQLFSGAWSPSDNWREWVGQPSFLIGVVPFGLAVLTALAAWPQRTESIGRRVLIFLGVAAVCLVLPLVLPTPVTALLITAAVCLILAIGALPLLDTRYTAFPIQLGILAIALISAYPYLRPAWFEVLPDNTNAIVASNNDELWLANLHAERVEGNIVLETLWQSTAVMPKDYTAFVHFLDDQEQIVAQSDALLVDSDNVPTTGWSPGYVVTQTYTMPDNAAITHIRYGLYDRDTLERVFIRDIGDSQNGIEVIRVENAVIIPLTPAP